jgi:hypothetical protein
MRTSKPTTTLLHLLSTQVSYSQFDHRFIRDDDLPSPQCLLAKYLFLSFDKQDQIWTTLKTFLELTDCLATQICRHGPKARTWQIKEDLVRDMLKEVSQLVASFLRNRKSDDLYRIILETWEEEQKKLIKGVRNERMQRVFRGLKRAKLSYRAMCDTVFAKDNPFTP